MNPVIEKLLILQARDQALKLHKSHEKALPGERVSIEAKRAAAKQTCDTVREKLRANELERRKLQGDAQAKRDSIGRYKTQQMQTRKNDEFQALRHEIQHAEGDIQKIEDRELELMEEAEKLGTGVRIAEAELAKTLAACLQQETALAEKDGNLKRRLTGLAEERAKAAAEIEEDTCTLYERIFKNKGDAAIVPLEHEICQGCHLKVPATTTSDVRAEIGLTQCPNCARILYRVI